MAEMNENREEEKAEGAAAADQTPGHESALTRDPDDASNALARVQQIFERLEDLPENKRQKKESGENEEKSEAAPVTPEAAEELREICEKLHPSDIAWVLEALPLDERLALWNFVKSERDGEILIEVNDGVRETLIDAMDRDELVDAVETLDTDEIADLVPDLPPDVTAEVQETLSLEERSQLRAAMSYPEDSVGSRMDFEMVSVREESTLAAVLAYLRRFDSLPDHSDKVFVVDRHGHFKGTLLLTKILVSDPDSLVRDLMQKDVLTLSPLDDVGDAAQAFERYDLVSAAVVDETGRLVGRLTVDEVVDVIREESEEDAYGAVGLDEDQDIFSSVWETAKSRWLWLGVNLCTAFFASRVISAFDETIEKVVALAALMPIVAGMAGNSGNQTLTLLVRSMAMGQVTESNAPEVVRREVMVAICNGILCGLVAGSLAWLLYADTAQGMKLGFVMFLAMMLNILLGARGCGGSDASQGARTRSGDGRIGASYLHDRFGRIPDFPVSRDGFLPLRNRLCHQNLQFAKRVSSESVKLGQLNEWSGGTCGPAIFHPKRTN